MQIEQEIVQVIGTDSDGSWHGYTGNAGDCFADHELPVSAYQLGEKVVIVPFIKNFFGSPASGDWKYSVALPNVRLASAKST